MSEAASIAHVLAHDVGKYVARTARNLPSSGPIPEVLIAMLMRDLFAPLPSGPTPRARFEALAAELAAAGVDDPKIGAARASFVALDALLSAITARDPSAVRSAAAEALSIERALRTLAAEQTARR